MTQKKILYVTLFIYAALGLYTLWHHEMWRDELQAWSLARDSKNLGELHHNLRYESHPILWHGCLHYLSALWDDPKIMQIFNFLLAVGSIYLILFCSPLPTAVKVGLTFHYYLFYEYLILSRNYGLGLFLTLLATSIYCSENKKKWWLFGLTLLLLCQTSVYGIFIAFGFLAFTHFQELDPKRLIKIFVVIGAIVAIIQIIPPPDSAVMQKELDQWPKIIRSAGSYWQGLFPLMPLKHHYREQNIVSDDNLRGLLGLLVLGLLAHSIFKTNRRAYFFFAAATTALILFIHFIHYGAIRHHGHFFIILVVTLWLCGESKMTKTLQAIVISIIIAGIVASSWAQYCDIKYTFSAARETAQFIETQGLADQFLAGHLDAGTSAVSAYLGKPIYYLNGQRRGSYILWNEDRLQLDANRAVANGMKLAKKEGKTFVLITTYPMKQYKELASFKGDIVASESFWVYRF